MKLNLGASDRSIPGYLSVDRVYPADVIADLEQPWPWATSSVEEVIAHDIIEHLPDKIHTLNELYRVLVPGGRADIVVPSTRGAGAWCDPTHKSYWNASSFEYFQNGNFAWKRFHASYGITSCFNILSLSQKAYSTPYDEVWKVFVLLEAIK